VRHPGMPDGAAVFILEFSNSEFLNSSS